MYNQMGNVPSLKNSNAVNQGEIQKVKERMNTYGTTGQGMNAGIATGETTMTTGAMANLSNSTAVGQQEIQKVRQKIQNSGFQNMNTTNLS